jgi:hypothetical protein
MSLIAPCLAALCQPVAALAVPASPPPPPPPPQLAYEAVLDAAAEPAPPLSPRAGPGLAHAPLEEASALHARGLGLGRIDLLRGGKLLLTNGVTTIEGASGGGLASFATIAGRQMAGGAGLSAHGTLIELPDFGWRSFGASLGLGDRLELSYARIDFDTRAVGAALGLGQGYTFSQDVFAAKLRLAGDLVYGPAWLPAIAAGVQAKRSPNGAVLAALGAADDSGTDYTLTATKLLLGQSLLVNAGLRYTKANEAGLLGFGSVAGAGYTLQFEGSLGYQLSRRAVIGAEYRTKPDNLGLGEDDWMDLFAAYALTRNITVTAAYVDLGSIATISGQRGGLLSAQVAF